jgi:hypothetical protein
MAYINGEFEHENHEIKIEVLEPHNYESDYKDGMQISVEWDSMHSTTLQEFRDILKWMSEKADYIEKNFTKKGKAKKISVKG